MNDGRVLFISCSAQPVIIYDPDTDSVESVPDIPVASGNYYTGCNLPDGRVFLCPYGAKEAVVYDPVTRKVSSSGSFAGGGTYRGAVTLKDGRVFCVPYRAQRAPLISFGAPLSVDEQPGINFSTSPYFNKY